MSPVTSINLSSAIPLWNNFTSFQPFPVPFSFNPSLFHFYQNHFHWKPYYFIIYHDDKIAGIFPIVDTGKAIVSLPHFSYGGVLEKENSFINKADLMQSVFSFVSRNNVTPGFYKIEISEINHLHQKKPKNFLLRSFGGQQDNRFVKSEKVTYWIELKDEVILFNSLGSNLRHKINKASRTGFVLKTGGIELLSDFYAVYRKNIAMLRSLNYGKGFFKGLFENWFYGEIKFFVVYYQNKPAGAALLASYNGFYENIFFATLREVRPFYISDWLHWQMMQYVFSKDEKKGPNHKSPVYSFGRSTEYSSVHTYKSHWPVTITPLFVYSDLKDIKQNKLIKNIWGIVPQCIARNLGPKLIKRLY